MRQYNFVFYIVDPETDDTLGYVERTVWANSRADAWAIATEWAHDNGYNDFEEDN